MKLTREALDFYHENGYLMIEEYFTDHEMNLLSEEFPKTIDKNSPRIILEDNGEVRSVFAPHMVNKRFENLSQLDRLVIPCEQILKSKIYLHQFKINTKKAFKGDWWEWHQDFPYWHFDDGIKEPRMVSVMIYLQDTDSSNGALLLIPGSHKPGIAKFADKAILGNYTGGDNDNDGNDNAPYLSSLNSNIKFTVDHHIIKDFAKEKGIVTASGKKGTTLFFDCNIFHASNNNMSPFDRDAVIITYNSVNNLPGYIEKRRPEFLVGRDYDPIEAIKNTL